LRSSGDPADLAQLLWKISNARAPQGRYGAGNGSFWVPRARTLLPQRIFDALLRRSYKLQ
jgi:hypothetical protein